MDQINKAYTVIIPCFNAENWINRTLENALAQSLPPQEIIVVDDASTDGSLDILHAFAARHSQVRLIENTRNCGPAGARNLALEAAETQWVLFLDSDDEIAPSLASACLERLDWLREERGGQWVLSSTAYYLVDADDRKLAPVPIRWQQVEAVGTFGWLLVRNPIITSGAMVQRAMILESGGFDGTVSPAEDYDMWLKLSRKGGFAYVDEVLANIRRHSGNISARLKLMLARERMILEQYDPAVMASAILRRKLPKARNLADAASVLFRVDEWEQGLVHLQKALSDQPDFVLAVFLKGVFYLHMEEWETSCTCFAKALEIDSAHAESLNNLGAIYAMQGEIDKAAVMLHKALEVKSGYMDAERNLALLNTPHSADPAQWHWTTRQLRQVLPVYTDS